MNPRERILAALDHKQSDRIPYHIEFTSEARQRLAAFMDDPNFEGQLGQHMAITKVLAPNFPHEIRLNHFQDEFGVIWDRTHDKSLGLPQPVLSEPAMKDDRLPDPDDPGRNAHLSAFIAENQDKFRVVKLSHTLFERAWSLRGFQQFLIDL